MTRVPGRRAGWIAATLLVAIGTYLFLRGEDDWHRSLTEPTADADYYYVYLPSLVLDRDLDFANEYQVTGNWYRFGTTATGRPGNVFGIGPALFQLPAFLVGHGVALATGDRADGFSTWETGLVLWTAIPYTIGALLLAVRLARRRAGRAGAAWAGALVAVVAGPALYYAVRQPGYAHPYAAFAVALLVERWDASYDGEGPRSLRTWLVLGAALGAAMLARPQLALWGVTLAAAALDDVRRRGELPVARLLARWGAGAAMALVVFAPQLIAWELLYGAWYVVPQGEGFMWWDQPAWIETLFSSRNGLFPWAPLYVPTLLGLAVVTARARLVSVLLVGVAAQAVVNGAVWDWWGGGSFGGRRFDSAYVVFALGGTALIERGVRLARAGAAAAATWRARALALLAITMLVGGGLAAYAQWRLARLTSVISAKIFGGHAPAAMYQRRVGGVSGEIAGWLSFAVTLPVRAGFALRHDVTLRGYDPLSGVHYLGDTYPGINGHPDKVRDTISFRDLREPKFRGLAHATASEARMTAPRARIFVGLNRRGRVRIQLALVGQGHARVAFDDVTLAERELAGAEIVEVEVRAPARGVHWLVVDAPVGTIVREPELFASQ